MRLLIFSGPQSPLAVRYPRPKKPLTLPPLIHRTLHTALDPQAPSVGVQDNTLIIPQPGALTKHSSNGGDDEYESTVKIQLVSADNVLAALTDALAVLAKLKGIQGIDEVLLGLPENVDDATWVDVWKTVTTSSLDVKHWGTLNLRQGTLTALCDVRAPYVNELDVKDCETLPREYIAFAAKRGIQLWASGGGAGFDPLPSAELHNLLQEFRPKLAAIAPSANLESIGSLIVPSEDGQRFDDTAAPGVAVDWTLNYTLLSRKRNIVKDKGYIVAANLA